MERRDDEPKPKLRDGKPITTRNALSGECRWISGEPLGDAPMCGQPTVSASWCAYHYTRCYTGHRYVPDHRPPR